MKILILNPPSIKEGRAYIKEGRCEQRLSSFQYIMMPISLPSIAGILRKDSHEIMIIDCVAINKGITEILGQISEFNPSLIIVNISTVTYHDDLKAIDVIRSNFANTHLTGIGNHVSSLPEQVLKESKLDSVILGEPEFVALELVSHLSRAEDLSGVQAFAYKVNGRIAINSRINFINDLDGLPFPARDLMDNEKYTLPVINEPYALIVSSRGCPYECVFCTAHQYYGRKLRLRSPSNIVEEIKEVRCKYGIKNISMWSDTFTLNRDFVIQVCNLIIKENLDIRWMCNSRVDTVDPELLSYMKKSNCIGISYGVESGSQIILDNIKKKTTISQIENAISWTKEAGIETLAHVIFGLPGETKDTINETINFIIRLEPDYVQFYCAIPFPGTEFYKMAKEDNMLVTEDWTRFELNQAIISSPSLSSAELHKSRVEAYRRFYLRPKYILGRIKKTKSLKGFILLFRQGFNFTKSWILNI
jgi:radical SAM superfamily enzyme YgiQ (UPF0313 family)